jgi:hypothetical protein
VAPSTRTPAARAQRPATSRAQRPATSRFLSGGRFLLTDVDARRLHGERAKLHGGARCTKPPTPDHIAEHLAAMRVPAGRNGGPPQRFTVQRRADGAYLTGPGLDRRSNRYVFEALAGRPPRTPPTKRTQAPTGPVTAAASQDVVMPGFNQSMFARVPEGRRGVVRRGPAAHY